MPMEFGQVLRRRRMIRSYEETRAVPAQAIDAVLTAALRAPSAGFTQGISLLVLTSASDREAFWRLAAEAETTWLRGMRTAPVLILVWTSEEAYLDRYAEPDKGWADRDPARWSAPYWFVDAGMASMAALLSAVDQELGACFFGIPTDRISAVREGFQRAREPAERRCHQPRLPGLRRNPARPRVGYASPPQSSFTTEPGSHAP